VLLAFAAAAGLFFALALGATAIPGAGVGFDDASGALARCGATGALVLAVELALRLATLRSARLAAAIVPFSAGLHTFGAVVLFATLNIRASSGWSVRQQSALLAPALFCAGVALGLLVPGMVALAETACAFAYAHALEQLAARLFRCSKFAGALVAALGVGAGAYVVYLYIRPETRPEVVAALVRAAVRRA
jgi:hypothetical protein